MRTNQLKVGERGRFTILIPPPNLTAQLHLGHALDFFIQDTLLREWQAKNPQGVTKWHVGFDHAGIATQILVEKEMRKEGINPQEIPREEFTSYITKWVESKRDSILGQVKKMGLENSADWKNGRFTMDDNYKETVTNAFVQLHKDKLIYRSQRMVNWDCTLGTALSDLEVEHKDTDGNLYHIRYKGEKGYVIVATTRPETIFGDVAIMLHPEDSRSESISDVKIPFTETKIPVIKDEIVDMKYGSGIVKVTPAHDFNDFEVGRRHKLSLTKSIMNEKGKMTGEYVPKQYRGLDRFEARKVIVADLKEAGLLEKVERCRHSVPYGDRSNSILEPRVTVQWFIDAKKMAKPVLERLPQVEMNASGRKELKRWLENIEPWCISRQIKWGHRIPVWWYESQSGTKEKKYVVGANEAEGEEK